MEEGGRESKARTQNRILADASLCQAVEGQSRNGGRGREYFRKVQCTKVRRGV